MSRLQLLAVCFLGLVSVLDGETVSALAQVDDKKQGDEVSATEALRRAAYIRTMHHLAKSFKVLRMTKNGASRCDVVNESVLNWDDHARHPNVIYPGTTWIWHHNGRPQAIAEIYNYWGVVGKWNLFLCSFSSDRLDFDDGSTKWTPPRSDSSPQEIPGAPDVGKTPSARTLQLTGLSRRFEAHQFYEGGRFALRLLPQPIYRYKDEGAGILDGAMYAFVNGTNPEVLTLIEAHQTGDGHVRWQASFGALSIAKCVVQVDDKEFWSCQPYAEAASDPRGILIRTFPVMDAEPIKADSPK